MIPLSRNRDPNLIHHNFTGNLKRKLERELLENQRKILRGEIERHAFESDRWKAAKDQLKVETRDKCAYCEAPTSLVAYGDVEHYRPKKTYWWLAYSYENYLLSCQLCNQKFKKAKFPVKNNRMGGPRITRNTKDEHIERLAGRIAPDPLDQDDHDAFVRLHKRERPYLLNPYVDKPEDYYAWRADDVLSEVELVPIHSKPSSKPFVKAAVKDYGLNRQELREARYGHYLSFKTFKNVLREASISAPTRTQTEHVVKEMKSDKSPFAGMIRYFDRTL
ncbi:MAG: hypothetical protein JSV10_10335 [Candidatus Zixiibacteriota bacterium]|nr:MAG: hypothetical protein JSV10_10335 [candidate division Zixibacteria bacterium]